VAYQLSDTYRSDGPANDTSSFASFVGSALKGAESIYNLRTKRRRDREDEQDRATNRERQQAEEGRAKARETRDRQEFETRQDQSGYVRTGTTLREDGEKLTKSGNVLGMMAGALMMGQDEKARRAGQEWVKGKESTTERSERQRLEREQGTARVRGEAAAEVARIRADAAKEVQDSREQLREREMELRIMGRWNQSGGGSNSKTASEREIERAEKGVGNARTRYDRTMARRPQPTEMDVLDVDAQGNPSRFSRQYEERLRNWRGDSTMVANVLDKQESQLGRLLGDEPEPETPRGPAPPKRGGFNSPAGQAIQAQYDAAAQEYQAALERITNPEKRALARQRYEQRVKEIARAVGDTDR